MPATGVAQQGARRETLSFVWIVNMTAVHAGGGKGDMSLGRNVQGGIDPGTAKMPTQYDHEAAKRREDLEDSMLGLEGLSKAIGSRNLALARALVAGGGRMSMGATQYWGHL